MNPNDIPPTGKMTRQDIADLLKSLGKPGKNRAAKIAAVEKLGLQNPNALGGHGVHLTVETYKEF